jgi:hypothetical protein
MDSGFTSAALALAAGAFVAPFAHAGGVRIVRLLGDKNFPDIASAVAAAQEGDVLLVGQGDYGPFTLDRKSLSIWAAPGASVTVHNDQGAPWSSSIVNLATGQTVILSGLEIQGAHSSDALVLANSQGIVRIQDCEIAGWGGWIAPSCSGSDGSPGVSVNGCTAVALLRCSLRGGAGEWISEFACWCADGLDSAWAGAGASALRVDSSRVALYDTQVVGGTGGSFTGKTGCGDHPGDGATAMTAASSEAFASGGTFQGGDGGYAPGWAPIFGSGGSGVFLDSRSVLDALDCQLAGGSGLPPGAPSSGTGWVTPLAGTRRVVIAPALLPEHSQLDVQLDGLAGDEVWMPRSTRLDHQLSQPLLSVWLISLPLRMPVAPSATLPPGGTSATLPALFIPLGATHALWATQGMFVSPGEARLGSVRQLLSLSLTVGPDCNGNGTSDYVDVLFGGAPDLNHNLIPDACPGG